MSDIKEYIIVFSLLILILGSGGYICYKLYIGQIHECTGHPLEYAAQKYEQDYGNPFYGFGNFQDANDITFHLTFNSSGVYPDELYHPKLVNPKRLPSVNATELQANFDKPMNSS